MERAARPGNLSFKQSKTEHGLKAEAEPSTELPSEKLMGASFALPPSPSNRRISSSAVGSASKVLQLMTERHEHLTASNEHIAASVEAAGLNGASVTQKAA